MSNRTVEKVKGTSLESRLPTDRLELRKPLSEEGPFRREGLWAGGGRRAHAAGPLPLFWLEASRPERLRESMHRSKAGGAGRGGKITSEGGCGGS